MKIEVSELDVKFIKDRSDRDDLHVICSENTIFIQFNEERIPTKSFAVSYLCSLWSIPNANNSSCANSMRTETHGTHIQVDYY